jgi:hypothetical protein
MARTPEEVFQHHAQALGVGDLDEIVADYTHDAVFITPAVVLRGKDGSFRGQSSPRRWPTVIAMPARKAADLCLWRAPCGGFLWPCRGRSDLVAEAEVPLARIGYVALG